jgi:hypothetical protein
MRDFLVPIPRGGGDAQVFQQSPKPTGGDRSYSPKGLHLVHILIHLLDLGVAQGSMLFVNLIFYVLVLQLLLLLDK